MSQIDKLNIMQQNSVHKVFVSLNSHTEECSSCTDMRDIDYNAVMSVPKPDKKTSKKPPST